MLTGVQFMLKIIRNMVMYNKFKYFGKIIKNGDRSVITNRSTVAFFKNRNNSGCFHRVEHLCCDKLRLKMNLRTGSSTLEQPLITKLGIQSSPTDFGSMATNVL
jgi:hypothetical protein